MRENPNPAPRRGRPAQSPPALWDQEPADRSQPLWRRAASREVPPRPLLSHRDVEPAWPPSLEGRAAVERQRRPPQSGGPPQVASYLDEDNQAYVLRDLDDGEE